jgi:hypothetical protein
MEFPTRSKSMGLPNRFRSVDVTNPGFGGVVRACAPRPSVRWIIPVTIAVLAIVTVDACFSGMAAAPKPLMPFFNHALARRGCTQEDAPALEIYLTRVPFSGEGDPPPPSIRIEISSPVSESIPRGTFRLSPLRRNTAVPGRIVRAMLEEEGKGLVWLTGSVMIGGPTSTDRVTGRFDVSVPGGKKWSGTFAADYSKRTSVCGG